MKLSKRMRKFFNNPSESEWNNWQWQIRNRITRLEDLEKIISLTSDEKEGIKRVLKTYRMAITPYYASLMDEKDPLCPIRMQAVPTIYETHKSKADLHDPLAEDRDMVAPNLVHRYPDRVLFLVTDQCSMYCRFCTRRRLVGQVDKPRKISELERAFEYIKRNKRVRDVVISGGDPLTTSDEHIEYIVKRLRDIKHVEIIRIGSRTPVVLPMRITDNLVRMLKKYHPIYLNTHFNHPREVTEESKIACERLSDGGVVVSNQSVLLRRINSSYVIMKKLCHLLLKIRVRPYYIFQCDLSEGIEHFRTPVSKGFEIIERMRGHTSGLAVPTLVVDMPGGGGKVPIFPNYLISMSENATIFRNYKGFISIYQDPVEKDCTCVTEKDYEKDPVAHSPEGLGHLFDKRKVSIEPKE
ncbi:MAG: lysine 2,3-aminomutase [Deltaproteobacteria bacterium]|nr:lysine 2,3-aminomutase [Deltaproteobacteria bacterium]